MFIEEIKRGKQTWCILQCDQCLKIYDARRAKHNLYINQFCSKTCVSFARKKDGLIANNSKETSLKKFGTFYPMQSKLVQDKMKQTNLKRYGVENVYASQCVKEKKIKTSLKKRGVSFPSQCAQVQLKIKQANLFKRGVENVAQDSLVQEKQRLTLYKKYGVHNSFQIPAIAFRAQSPEAIRKRFEHKNVFISSQEDKCYEFLKQMFKNVERQKYVNGWIIDLFVKDIDLYIQVDGIYWHGLDRSLEEIKQFKSKRDVSIYETILKDQKQNHYFKENNLKLLRITDLEINKCNSLEDFKKLLMSISLS